MKLTLHTTPPNPSNDINSTVAFRSSVGQYGYLPPQETAPSLTHKIRGVSGKHLVTTSKYNEMSNSNLSDNKSINNNNKNKNNMNINKQAAAVLSTSWD